jgi:hypothetical protein
MWGMRIGYFAALSRSSDERRDVGVNSVTGKVRGTVLPRVIARKNGAQVRLYSLPGNDLTYRFPLIVETLVLRASRGSHAHPRLCWNPSSGHDSLCQIMSGGGFVLANGRSQ